MALEWGYYSFDLGMREPFDIAIAKAFNMQPRAIDGMGVCDELSITYARHDNTESPSLYLYFAIKRLLPKAADLDDIGDNGLVEQYTLPSGKPVVIVNYLDGQYEVIVHKDSEPEITQLCDLWKIQHNPEQP